MQRSFAFRLSVICLLAAAPLFAAAQSSKPAAKPGKSAAKTKPVPKQRTVTTHASVTINGKSIPYTATAGTLLIYNKKHKAIASVFYIAYTKDGVKDPSTRPVTFAWNGGPGGASALVDIGGFGPRRLVWPQPGSAQGELPPYHLVNNQYSILNKTDLVFIDAVGTGYSRIVGKGTPKMFYGFNEDASTFAKIIQQYLDHFHRWNSPKFLLGESYGTTRSAVLSQILQNDDNMDLNGVILLSEVLNFGDGIDQPQLDPGNIRPYWLALPTYAATAWYHHKLPNDPHLMPLLKQVEAYAEGPYEHALQLGSQLPATQKKAVAEKLQQFTSIPASYWMRADLRVNGPEFEKHLLQGEDETTGRLDTRFSGPTIDPLGEIAQYDPQGAAISSAYVSLFNSYVRKDLHFGTGLTYLPMTDFHGHPWSMLHAQPQLQPMGSSRYAGKSMNVMPDLAYAMKTNPNLKVMLNGGYYDLATPFFAALYEMHHLNIPERLEKNISYHFYRSGHMVYVNPPSLHKLHDNVAAFIRSTDSGQM